MDRSQLSPVRLLIVDDDDAMRLIVRRFFQRSPPPQGIEITEAESGERAIELLAEREFDCILSDYRMGAVSGLDVLAYAMRERPEAVRLLMTGFYTADLHAEATLHAHVHDVMEKPMTSQELGALLNDRVLERYLRVAPPTRP